MEIAVIAWINDIDDISGRWDIDMCLGHIALKNEKYYNYFKKRKQEWYWVLVDNWAHELGDCLEGEELINLTKEIGSCLVLPDKLNDHTTTILKTTEFYNKYKHLKWDIEFMCVAQWDTLESFIQCYKHFTKFIPCERIAIPFNVCFYTDWPFDYDKAKTESQKKCMRRANLLAYMYDNKILSLDHNHHLLWLRDPLEFILEKKYKKGYLWNFLDTSDSSCAYVHWVKWIYIDKKEWLKVEKVWSTEILEDYICTEREIEIIKQNIYDLKDICSGWDKSTYLELTASG